MADRRFRLSGVRGRTTVISVAVVGVVLAASGVAFTTLARNRIESSIADSARARLAAVVAIVGSGGDVLGNGDAELFTQLIDSKGAVIAADAALQGAPPLISVEPPGQRLEIRIAELPEGAPDDDGPYFVVAEAVQLDGEAGIALVAASLEDSAEALGATLPLLIGGIIAIAAVVGGTTWILTGRALAPVDQMRAEAAGISAEALDRRLAVPESGDEIERLAQTLNEMLGRLDRSATAQRRFVADASHELRSPLATMRAMVEVSGQDAVAAGQVRFFTDLEDELERMERLVADLLWLARFEEAVPDSIQEEVDLAELAAVEARRPRPESGIVIHASGLSPAPVLGDPDRLTQLLRNLVENAIRHATSSVWLETATEKGAALLRVGDDGPGIDDGDRERVFERFVRLDVSRTRSTGGAGLGLAVVRSIAQAHGGTATVVHPRHSGATFQVTLPAVQT